MVRVALACVALHVDSQLEVHYLYLLVNGGERIAFLADVFVLCANRHRLAHSTGVMPLKLDQLKAVNAPAVGGVT